MTIAVTIIPEKGQQPETLFINYVQRPYTSIDDANHSTTEKCKYAPIILDGEQTTRVYFANYPLAVKWCKTYIRESDYIVKVDDNTGLTNNQENWYANVIRIKAGTLEQEYPDVYQTCPYCGNAFFKTTKNPRKKYCSEQHRKNHNSLINKAKKRKQVLDK